MPNLLVHENSPYLLQHQNNPVDWYPWGTAALAKAQQEQKPIFLSIGYAACHWCHVMERESFEDPEIAALMNRYFINIKVDREERPDLDQIYMNAVVAMTGHGGWPMSVFLTPEGQPFFGGTYFPPVSRYHLPGFKDVLLSVAQAWQNQRQQILESSQKITEYLQESLRTRSTDQNQALDQSVLQKATTLLLENYDWEHGGWGSAPKFPQPMLVDFLLQQATLGDHHALNAACHTLDCMSKGGMYDVVGGGFSRYSTDVQWLIPHFEKMLYDNALLGRAYLHGYLVSGNPLYKRVCEETLEFIQRELRDEAGGFYSSLDADSEGEEGKFYVWTLEEIRAALGNEQDFEFFTTAYHLTETGNFEGKTVLQRALTDAELVERYSASPVEITNRLIACHARLLSSRSHRVRPATDDKVLVSWNGLALITFSEAARHLGREDFLKTARANAAFLLQKLHPDDRLLRSWRAGKAQHNAYLEDYAALILGLLSLYQTDFNSEWFSAAQRLTNEMVKHFSDRAGSFYDTRDDHEPLLMRPKELQDNATPSGNAMATIALLQMAKFTGRVEWQELAEQTLLLAQPLAERYPNAFGFWLSALNFAITPTQEIVLVGKPADPQMESLLKVIWSAYRPFAITAAGTYSDSSGCPPILAGRTMVNGKPTVYVCQNWACQMPVTEPEELSSQISSSSSRLTGQ